MVPLWSPALAGLLLFLGCTIAFAQGDPKRGEYIAKAAGCLGCHTESGGKAPAYGGGRALVSSFGTFYGPNITPHPDAGIGRWSEADFMRAMREGVRPDGASYFPAFPYPSFSGMVDADLRDLWAYLRTLKPSANASKPHALRFPFGFRFLVRIWKWLFFRPAPFATEPARNAQVNRGAYLTNVLGHCGECHTPRNFLGAPKRDRFMGGAKLGDGASAPNLTPTRLKKLGDKDLFDFLKYGQWPDGDVVGETMGEVIRNTTSQLSEQDLQAMVAYLRSLPPLPEEPK
ncbi:MAG TPA: cytochrome c [Burkholderiales bacterium]|nr:cytochrome c [Burkholderiales bacterium]